MNMNNNILIAAAMMLATQNQEHFDTGHKARYQPYPLKNKRIISNNPKKRPYTQPKAFNRVQYKIPYPIKNKENIP